MTEHQASRTLVKSPPELWTECSDASTLARHLNGSVGEIKITRLEPETAVAWEGDRLSGTVRLEPSGWGTRVVMTVRSAAPVGRPAATLGGPAATLGEPAATLSESAATASASAASESPNPPLRDPAPLPPDPEPPVPPELEPLSPGPARQGLIARMRAWLSGGRPEAATAIRSAPRAAPAPKGRPEADSDALPPPAPASEVASAARAASARPAEPPSRPAREPGPDAILAAALDSLGRAHHRPYSRA